MGKTNYKYQKLLVYLVCVLVLIFGFGLRLLWQEKAVAIPRNAPVTLVATVKSEPKISFDKTGLPAGRQVIEVGDAKVYASLFPKYSVGDRLRIEGKVDERGRIFNAKVEKVGEVSSITYRISDIRNQISDRIQSMLPSREATLVVGSVLGVDNIDRDFRDALISTGTIHVVVVSGQNLAIVAGLFLALPGFVGRRQSLVLATLAVFIYSLLTGFAPPVLRASLMVLVASVSVFLGRQTLPVLNLLIAALVILFISPSALFEVSFQLTFAASLGIMTLGSWLGKIARGPVSSFPPVSARSQVIPKVNGKPDGDLRAAGSPSRTATPRNQVLNLFFDNAAVATSAYLFTAPIIFWHFGRLSLISPLANILVAEAVFPIMVFGFLTAGASLIFMPLAQLFAYLAFIPALYFVKVVELFASVF